MHDIAPYLNRAYQSEEELVARREKYRECTSLQRKQRKASRQIELLAENAALDEINSLDYLLDRDN